MRITWEQASARRLERQFLSAPGVKVSVAEVVEEMLGAHAQVMSAAELSVGVRLAGVTRQDVRAALGEERSLVKTFGPRGTIHLLPSAGLPVWSGALSALPAAPSPFAPEIRLTAGQTEEVVAAIGDALEGASLTIDELTAEVVARTGPWAGDEVMPAFQTMWPRWRQVMHLAGHAGVLCFGPNRGRKVTYTRPPRFTPLPANAAVSLLVREHLRSYGPATPAHFAKWLGTSRSWAAEVFASLASAGEIERVDFAPVDGPAWVVTGDTGFPASAPRGVRLLPYFDAYGIAAQPRESLFPGVAYERALARGQAGNYPVVLVDGVVAGVWHQRRQGRRTTVTVELFGELTGARRRELEAQAERVGEVLEARAELVLGAVTVGPHA
ncbi:winged helix DNA-binding domain-containing protein [Streptomyces cavernae]|uniref:winged helix DNA-binding domain-containing protein n=1 Tax=Streptomyces cavernae TaxID=2259034 RepID=UPI000FEBA249|nr:winged helix DNA-binding domain-containing protein [Streptomyces cavernae]